MINLLLVAREAERLTGSRLYGRQQRMDGNNVSREPLPLQVIVKDSDLSVVRGQELAYAFRTWV